MGTGETSASLTPIGESCDAVANSPAFSSDRTIVDEAGEIGL
jgi:hypothetical protein